MFLSRRENGIYYLYYESGTGKRRKVTTGQNRLAKAVEFMRTFHPVGESPQREVREVVEGFILRHGYRYSPATIEHFRVALREYLRIMGNGQVTAVDASKFLSTKMAETSVWTARKYHIALRSAYNHMKEPNPFAEVPQLKPPERPPIFLQRREYKKLLACLRRKGGKWMGPLVVILTLTGMRAGELLQLKWAEVDFEKKTLLVTGPTSKGKRNRLIPMHAQVVRALRALPRHGERVVWRYRLNTVEKKFKAAVRECGFDPRLRLHSLRHTFASWLAQDGVSLYKIGILLGHKDVRTSQIYAHLAPSDLDQEVQNLKL